MRRVGLNALLLLLVAALAGLVWWQTQQQEQQAQSERLLPASVVEINSILIERPREPSPTLELQREGELWSLVQPIAMEANPIKVRQLFTLLDEKVEASYPTANKDLSAYGLEPKNLLLSFNGHQLVLGDSNPVSNRRYILNAGQIQLVNETVYALLQEDWINFVSLKVVPDKLQLTSVQLPEGFADSPQLLANWKSAEALRIEALDPTLLTPQMQKVFLKGTVATQELLILNLKDEIVLADVAKQLVYVLPISQATQLFPAKTGLEVAPK